MQGQQPAAPADAPAEVGEPGDLQSIMGGEEQAPTGEGGPVSPAPAEPTQP
jgi:hypothetical protein